MLRWWDWVVVFLIACIGACSEGQALPQGFEQVSSESEPVQIYSDNAGSEIRIASLETIRFLNSNLDPDLASNDRSKALIAALSVLDLGMPDVTETLDASKTHPMVEGSAYTENGDEVNFVAAWQTLDKAESIVLVLMPAKAYKREYATSLARADWKVADIKPNAPEEPRETIAENQDKFVSNSKYPPPIRTDSNILGYVDWHNVTDFEMHAKSGDKEAPRAITFVDISPERKGPDVALKEAVKKFQISRPKFSKIIETDIARQLVGTSNFIALGTSKRHGKDAIVFAEIYQSKGSDTLSVFLLEADEKTYESWGGIAAALSSRGVIDTPSDIPQRYCEQLASASMDQQLAFYHMAYTHVMKSYFMGIVSTHTSTLTMMQGLNYDLLFDGEFSLETITNSK